MRSTFLVVCLLLLGANGAAAQASWITINEPGEWSDNATLSVALGTRIRIVGQAYHPQGIQAINVAAQTATLRRQSNGVVDFEVVLNATPGMSTVQVIAQVVGGGTVTKDLKLAITGGGGAAPQPQARPQVAAAPAPAYSGSSAMVRSLFVPGLGQFYTKRPALGAVFLGAGAGALAFGIMSERTTVRCLSPEVNGECNANDIAGEESEKHMLIPGIAGFVAVGLISALEARSAANRMNAAGGRQDDGAGFELSVGAIGRGRYAVSFFRARF